MLLRTCSDLALLWPKPAAAALVQPLIWELTYAAGAALKRRKKKSIAITLRCKELKYKEINKCHTARIQAWIQT